MKRDLADISMILMVKNIQIKVINQLQEFLPRPLSRKNSRFGDIELSFLSETGPEEDDVVSRIFSQIKEHQQNFIQQLKSRSMEVKSAYDHVSHAHLD